MSTTIDGIITTGKFRGKNIEIDIDHDWRKTSLKIDGEKISNPVQAVNIMLRVDELPSVEIRMVSLPGGE